MKRKKTLTGDTGYQLHQADLSNIWKHPVAKAIVIGGAALGAIYVSGLFMQVLARSVRSYKDLREAVKH